MSAASVTTVSSSNARDSVRTLLRFEGSALFIIAMTLYVQADGSLKLFALLFLAPDLSLAFYLFGPRIGAFAYNAAHSTVGPIVLALSARAYGDALPLFPLALIWLAHVGFDRALGYGLKYATGFADTHLGRIGRKSQH